jgi:hypothetical protein
MDKQEIQACKPKIIQPEYFNPNAKLPYGVSADHIQRAMIDFVTFLGYVNEQLVKKEIQRFESMLMPANFSSMVGEFMSATIPKYCPSIVKNTYHNGHPDLIPAGLYAENSILHSKEGIEIKASRYLKGWQGHNPENIWLMVFVFDSNRPSDSQPKPFQFLMVLGAKLREQDWLFSGRSEKSRRTITASVTETGYKKMMKNWIYRIPELEKRRRNG